MTNRCAPSQNRLLLHLVLSAIGLGLMTRTHSLGFLRSTLLSFAAKTTCNKCLHFNVARIDNEALQG